LLDVDEIPRLVAAAGNAAEPAPGSDERYLPFG
jgi:hypothetical protein